MPTYSYICEKCNHQFELFFTLKDYTTNKENETPKCENCKSKKTHRNYSIDITSQVASVKKSDSELKTLGDLAKRNTDRLSNDEKAHLHRKHNAYKEETPQKELPKGMSRIKKPPKTKWN